MLFRTESILLRWIALLCCALVVPGDIPLMAQQPAAPAPAAADAPPPPIPPDQLDSLVAPIALYPDPLLAQVLAASTYPLELVQLQQWLMQNKNLKEQAMADAVKKQDWDASIQGMAALPDVVKQLADNIKWTSELGNAFLAQQSDVMEAVQRMRSKAKDSGKLKSTEQMKVETKVVESKTVVVIEQANPQVVYVPSYNPAVVWGAPPVYAYPPVAYPVGYAVAGAALSFGVGVAMGAMWSGGWGYNAGWGGGGNNNININNNNNFVNNSNRTSNRVNGGNRTGNGNSWQHNPQHRGGAPYGDRSTANKFGGGARADSVGNRQAGARQNAGQQGGGARSLDANRGGGGAAANRAGGGAAANRAGGGAAADRAGGGGDRIGNRQASGSSGSRGSGAFGGGGGGMSGASARSSSSRGASSVGGGGGSRSGGGGARGGGRRR